VQDPFTILLGIVLAALILGWFYFRKSPAPTTQRADLHLEGEFRPSRLQVLSGIPLHLHIHRLDSEPEDEWVVLSELNIEEPLPPMMTTVVHFESVPVGEFQMTCRLGKAQALLVAEKYSI
jgi:plastocyanin domain-containing protein